MDNGQVKAVTSHDSLTQARREHRIISCSSFYGLLTLFKSWLRPSPVSIQHSMYILSGS